MNKNDFFKGGLLLALFAGALSAQAVEVSEIVPTPGTVFNYGEFQEISVMFSGAVKVEGSSYVTYTDKSGTVVTHDFEFPYVEMRGDQRYDVLLNYAYYEPSDNVTFPPYYDTMLDEADFSKGFTVTVENIEAVDESALTLADGIENVTIENGTVTIAYQMELGPTVVNQEIPKVFYTFWPEGSGAGNAVIIFDQPIATVETAQIQMGHQTWGSETAGGDDPIPYFNFTPVINNQTVSVFMDGVDFQELADKFVKNDLSVYTEVTFFLHGIYGTNGLPYRANGLPVLVNYIPFENEPYPGDEPTPDDPTTGIGSLLNSEFNGDAMHKIYNLQGVEVNPDNLSRGIYIVNGKKVVIR